MSNAANLKPVFIPAQPVENPARRKMLVAATTGATAVGGGTAYLARAPRADVVA